MPQAVLVRLLFPASIDDGRLANRFTHCPIDHARLVMVGEALAVEAFLASKGSDVLDQPSEQVFINAVAHEVFVRPSRRVGLGKRPLLLVREGLELRGKSHCSAPFGSEPATSVVGSTSSKPAIALI